jgi:hypothetical protein
VAICLLLWTWQWHVDGKTLIHLQQLAKLQKLSLSGKGFGDAGLVYLKGLRELTTLALSGEGFKDSGLNQSKAMTKLRSLTLFNKQVSDRGLSDLQNERPSLEVKNP